MSDELYGRLGLARGADDEAIRRAWRRAMRTVHPDHARDETDRRERELAARLLNDAYWTLIDPERRRAYDARGGRFAFRRPVIRLPRRPVPDLRREVAARLAAIGVARARVPALLAELRAGPAGLLVDTRAGQWALVGAAALVPAFGVPLAGVPLGYALAGVLAVRLARDGAPTPLADAIACGRAAEVFLRALLRPGAGRGGSLDEEWAF